MTSALTEVLEKLEPCPWCGERLASLTVSEGSTFRWRKVDGCCTDGPEIRHDTMADDQAAAEIDSTQRAITAWNTRPALLRDAGDGWRAIESAPRDGTKVLLCHSGYAHPFYDRDRMPRVWVDFFRGGSWYNTAPSGQPTHWRPLPQPPAMHAPGGAGGGE
jgi:hypothetical protein